MSRARAKKVAAHGASRPGASRGSRAYCSVCRGAHSKSKHWSHKQKHREKYYGRTTAPVLSRYGGERDLRRKPAKAASKAKRGGKSSSVVISPKTARKLAKGGITRKEASKINKAAHKKNGAKKGGAKKPRTAAQKAATKRMIAAKKKR